MPSQLRRYDEPGHVHFWTISCYRRLSFFHDDVMRRIAVDAFAGLHRRFGVCLIGYVVMPDHVHLLLYPHAPGDSTPIPVRRLLQWFKQQVGYYGKRRLEEIMNSRGCLWSEPLNEWARQGLRRGSIWNVRGHDFNIDRRDTLMEKLDYVHANPITRGLVLRADEWESSSHRYYECPGTSALSMHWGGQWPIEW
ncbi:MAG TPA: transposase [Phycisphaerae bacterium]|nr:transposase [Phycisphaerae bacterium]